MDMDNDKAGEEIQAHILGGGDFKEVAEAFGKEVGAFHSRWEVEGFKWQF